MNPSPRPTSMLLTASLVASVMTARAAGNADRGAYLGPTPTCARSSIAG